MMLTMIDDKNEDKDKDKDEDDNEDEDNKPGAVSEQHYKSSNLLDGHRFSNC